MADLPLPALVHDPIRLDALAALSLLDTPPEEGFDDIAQLAALVCDTPVALVSLVAGDRQWFKARVGFPTCQTDLNASVCAHALAAPDLLIIPDLRVDPRTQANPLVTGEPFIQFYAGAPLQAPNGQVLGSLCVIDHKPRPQGLTAKQADGLLRLGRQVTTILRERELLRDMQAAQAAREASETSWRDLFGKLREGFIVGEVIRDGAGRITDWRYLEVNSAWGDLVGVPAETVAGRTIREVFPGIEDAWVDEFAQVVETGEPVTFTRQVGTLERWYGGRAQKLGANTFTVLFFEVTERVLAERARLAQEARLTTVMETVPVGILLAEAPSGRIVMGNGRLAEFLGHDTLYASSSGSYGRFVAFHADGRPVEGHEYPLAQITSGARKRASLEVQYQRPDGERRWIAIAGEAIEDEEGATVGAVVAVSDIEDRKAAEAHQDILNHELSHRLKNTLTLVQSIASQTLRNAPSLEAARDALAARLIVLGKAHDILLSGQTESASVDRVVQEAVNLHDDTGRRFRVSGTELHIGPSAALSLGLMLHELATNARKYGALSAPEGWVSIGWAVEGDGAEAAFQLDWQEQGGPPVTVPTRKGFGSRLIQRGLAGGDVSLRYHSEGVHCILSAPLAGLRVDVQPAALS